MHTPGCSEASGRGSRSRPDDDDVYAMMIIMSPREGRFEQLLPRFSAERRHMRRRHGAAAAASGGASRSEVIRAIIQEDSSYLPRGLWVRVASRTRVVGIPGSASEKCIASLDMSTPLALQYAVASCLSARPSTSPPSALQLQRGLSPQGVAAVSATYHHLADRFDLGGGRVPAGRASVREQA